MTRKFENHPDGYQVSLKETSMDKTMVITGDGQPYDVPEDLLGFFYLSEFFPELAEFEAVRRMGSEYDLNDGLWAEYEVAVYLNAHQFGTVRPCLFFTLIIDREAGTAVIKQNGVTKVWEDELTEEHDEEYQKTRLVGAFLNEVTRQGWELDEKQRQEAGE